jgi:hypothetical protein
MAKASINLIQARSLCTVAEYRIVKASLSSRLTDAQVRTKIRLVRDLRDKWRDQSKRQRRAAQETFGKRAVDASGRSKEKAKLFTDLLAHLETRAGTAAAPAKSSRGSKAPAKKAASVRAEHSFGKSAKKSAQRPTGESAGKSTGKPTGRSVGKSAARPAARTPKAAAPIGSLATLSASLAAAERTPATSITVALPAHRAVRPSRAAQRAATTAVKNKRFRESGERRTMSHVRASGKRAQARRDSRG